MNKKIIFILIMLLGVYPLLICQQEEEPIKEKVEVVNVEVPVRVHYKGRPVDNLSKDDFKVFEGKKLQTINGFFIKKKKIGTLTTRPESGQDQTLAGRYFVLIFQTTDYNDDFKKGLDYLFNEIISESDQLLVIVNKKTQAFHNLEEKNLVREDIERMIKNESHYDRLLMFQYIKQIEQELNMAKFETELRRSTRSDSSSRVVRTAQSHYIVKEFLTKYLIIWNDYKTKYLIPDIEQYHKFSRLLEKINREKWVINFYQMELFPRIIMPSDTRRILRNLIAELQISTNQEKVTFARIINKLLNEINRALKISNDFPSEEVSRIFSRVNAIHHSIFIRTNIPSLIQDIDYIRMASDLEANLNQICKQSGGILVNSKKVDLALDAISKEQDIYYLLTYAPANPDKIGKIKVKVNKRRHKVFYDDSLGTGLLPRETELEVVKGPPVKIKKASFKDKTLTLTLTDFYMKKDLGGKLNLRVRIKNRQDITVFDQSKDLNAKQKQVSLSLNFGGIGKGKYDIIIDVKDQFTQKTDSEIIQINM